MCHWKVRSVAYLSCLVWPFLPTKKKKGVERKCEAVRGVRTTKRRVFLRAIHLLPYW